MKRLRVVVEVAFVIFAVDELLPPPSPSPMSGRAVFAGWLGTYFLVRTAARGLLEELSGAGG